MRISRYTLMPIFCLHEASWRPTSVDLEHAKKGAINKIICFHSKTVLLVKSNNLNSCSKKTLILLEAIWLMKDINKGYIYTIIYLYMEF